MPKLDTSCGLTVQQIDRVKYTIKRAVGLKLPLLPDHLGVKLFLEGREAWTYSWRLLEHDALNPVHPFTVEVDSKLKKEFCHCKIRARLTFLCQLQLRPDIYKSIISIRKRAHTTSNPEVN